MDVRAKNYPYCVLARLISPYPVSARTRDLRAWLRENVGSAYETWVTGDYHIEGGKYYVEVHLKDDYAATLTTLRWA